MTKEGAITAAEADEAVQPKKKRLRLVLMLSVPVLIALVGGYLWLTSGRYVSTDNAYVQQDKVSVSAEVTGPILEVAVRENQRVKRGDLLFRIDPRPYRIALEQAEAQIAAAQVSVNQLQAESARRSRSTSSRPARPAPAPTSRAPPPTSLSPSGSSNGRPS
jgi:membrane fusion protein, multidrug efflux system